MIGPDLEYTINLDSKAVAAAGLTASDFAQAVREANFVNVAGNIDRDGKRSVIFADEALEDPESLGKA